MSTFLVCFRVCTMYSFVTAPHCPHVHGLQSSTVTATETKQRVRRAARLPTFSSDEEAAKSDDDLPTMNAALRSTYLLKLGVCCDFFVPLFRVCVCGYVDD